MEKSNLKVLASVKALLAVLGPAESIKGGRWEGSATADSITALRTLDASFQAELDVMKRGEIPAYRLADDTSLALESSFGLAVGIVGINCPSMDQLAVGMVKLSQIKTIRLLGLINAPSRHHPQSLVLTRTGRKAYDGSNALDGWRDVDVADRTLVLAASGALDLLDVSAKTLRTMISAQWIPHPGQRAFVAKSNAEMSDLDKSLFHLQYHVRVLHKARKLREYSQGRRGDYLGSSRRARGGPLDELFREMSAIGGQLWATEPVVAAEHVDEEEGVEGGQIWSDSDEDDSDEDSD